MIRIFLFLFLVAVSSTAGAIVIRGDVDDSSYRVPPSAFPALVDMPGEGHGVLIAPQWVITAAHTIPVASGLEQVAIGGIPRDVERVVIHPGYKSLPPGMIDQAMASGEAMLIVVFLASSDDIALIELALPVTDVVPVTIYEDNDEAGRIVQIVGKGATGTGAAGHDPAASHRTQLRRAFNKVSSAHGRWFCYVFDEPPIALRLEGITSNGDSGGPALIEVNGQWSLAGLSSWKVVQGDVRTARPGRYGQTNCNVRLSHYAEWIESVISGQPKAVDDAQPPAWLLGEFEDDYGIRYTISDREWHQQPDSRYRVVRWHADAQYLIARNAPANPGDPGKWTRIDWMALPGMPPYQWAFCMSAYAAVSEEAAERSDVAQRSSPMTGCNGHPFSRMRPAPTRPGTDTMETP